MFLSEVPDFLRSKSFPIEVALVSVTPPDKHGMCSLGVSVDVVKSGLDSAKVKIAQINRNMPRTFGDSLIPYKAFDYVVHADNEIPELPNIEIDEVSMAIGKNIAGIIKDGDILQTGIGGVPNAVLKNLTNKNDLGIHTEMFTDGLVELIKNGNVTNKTKKIMHGRSLTGFCMGTKQLYEFVHENPLIEFYPSEFTNDPFRIAQNDNMVSINSALQIDLTGQVCADSIGHKFYSGIGGQVDFIRGASRSKGGKAILAFPSTALNGKASRIVGQLLPGAGVVTSRGDVRYVVTEYGIAYLHGKTIRQRAIELIQIAHPKFRDELLEFVKNNKYVSFDQKLLQKGINYPVKCEEHNLFEKGDFYCRPVKITDDKKLQNLFYQRLSDKNDRPVPDLPSVFSNDKVFNFVNLDYNDSMAFCMFKHSDYDSELVGYIYYTVEDVENKIARMHIIVDKNFRSKGVGRFLTDKIFKYANSHNVAFIKCKVFNSNKSMKSLLTRLGERSVKWDMVAQGETIDFKFQLD